MSVNVDVYDAIKVMRQSLRMIDCIDLKEKYNVYLGLVWKARQKSEMNRLG